MPSADASPRRGAGHGPVGALAGGLAIRIRLTPRAGRERLCGWTVLADGSPVLGVRVAAPPVGGAANLALEAFLARALGVGRGAARVVAGGKSRLKTVNVAGDPVQLAAALEAALARATSAGPQ